MCDDHRILISNFILKILFCFLTVKLQISFVHINLINKSKIYFSDNTMSSSINIYIKEEITDCQEIKKEITDQSIKVELDESVEEFWNDDQEIEEKL